MTAASPSPAGSSSAQEQQQQHQQSDKNLKDPTFYRHAEEEKERPQNTFDHRAQGGPHLSYVWCGAGRAGGGSSNNNTANINNPEDATAVAAAADPDQQLHGQELYLGAEIGSDGNMYCIPGHAPRVLRLDPETNEAVLMGPTLPGKYKWLRGVLCGDSIYGLPCHADMVLKIHVPTGTISQLPIDYEGFFGDDPELIRQQRQQEWKYHGGSISPFDQCIYTIPQSATHVLKVDPATDKCTLFGPCLDGCYKWYGGVVGTVDGAIYGIPHNSAHVLRIHPETGVTLHGDFGTGGHKWHGASTAPANGVIVCVPANADQVLCITPAHPEPVLSLVGDETVLKSGRHRKDKKYKFLGAMGGPDGRVYHFPCAAERVLAVDTTTMTACEIGPNIYDHQMERICQNKWQNGVFVKERGCIFGIPLAGESVLRIDFNKMMDENEPEVTTWSLPAPHRGLSKWEGAVVAPNGIVYTVPNNHKAVLRIDQPALSSSSEEASAGKSRNSNSKPKVDRPDYRHREDLVYKSGIPTVRASAHRVKFSPKNRKHDPKPKNEAGEETGTLWLPEEIRKEQILAYDVAKYDFAGAIVALLQRCDPEMVGHFRDGSDRLEDFVVPTRSTWRTVNGGQVEQSQSYLSDNVAGDEGFNRVFTQLVEEVVLPDLKQRLLQVGAVSDSPTTFYYQCPPTLRLQPGPAWSQVKTHNDAEYGHQNGELNFWLPLTDRMLTGVDLWCESRFQADDYHPIPAKPGEIISFHGSSCRHYVNTNETRHCRVSFDFRVGVQGFFDPSWEMKGTNDDHTRRSFRL